MSVDETLRYLSPEAFKIYLRFVSVKPLVLKGLTEKLKKSKVTSSSSGNTRKQKAPFQKAEIPFLIKMINLSKTVMIKTSNCAFGEKRKAGM